MKLTLDPEATIEDLIPLLDSEDIIRITLHGLIETAHQKIIIYGYDDDRNLLKELRALYEQLVDFYGFDDQMLAEFDQAVKPWQQEGESVGN